MNKQHDKACKTKEKGNGQGSVFAYKGGPRHRWMLTVGWREGKPLRTGGIEPNKTAALRALRHAQLALEKGTLTPPDRITLGEWLQVWLEARRPEVAETTFEQYELYVRLYVPEELKNMRLQTVKRAHLHALSEDLTERNLKVATRSKVFQHLRSAFRAAIEREYVAINPVEGLRIRATAAEKASKKPKALTDAELERFLSAASADPLYPLIYTLFSLGLRRGEALGLRWQDIDFDSQTVSVRQQVKLLGNRPVIGPLKTATSRRTVYPGEDLLDLLKLRRETQRQDRARAGEGWQESGLVFTTTLGTMLDPHNVNRTLARLCAVAGVRRFGSHTGRYTDITNRLRAGQPLEVVAAHAGHDNPALTLRVYRDVPEDERRQYTFNLRQHRERASQPPSL